MALGELYQIVLVTSIFISGIVLGRLSLAIQYAIMKEISLKKKKEKKKIF